MAHALLVLLVLPVALALGPMTLPLHPGRLAGHGGQLVPRAARGAGEGGPMRILACSRGGDPGGVRGGGGGGGGGGGKKIKFILFFRVACLFYIFERERTLTSS